MYIPKQINLYFAKYKIYIQILNPEKKTTYRLYDGTQFNILPTLRLSI